MEACNTPPTRPEPSTELDTVMVNAHKISSSSMDKPTPSTGLPIATIPMPELECTELVAPKWTFGKPTRWLLPILLMSAPLLDNTDAMELNVEMALELDTKEFVIRMDAISIPSEWETNNSMDKE